MSGDTRIFLFQNSVHINKESLHVNLNDYSGCTKWQPVAGPGLKGSILREQGREGGRQEGHTGNNGPLVLLGVEKNKTDNMDAQV